MEAVAKFKSCPMSARKMRLVVDTIRGKDVDQALDILKFSRKEAAVWLEKVLVSAIANWREKAGVDPDEYELYIKEAFSDQGAPLKRFRPAPFGRAHRIRKHTNHITIVVENKVAFIEEDEFDEDYYDDEAEFEELEESTEE